MSKISDIVDVSIKIEKPASDNTAFSTLLLLFGANENSTIGTKVVALRQATELLDYGYTIASTEYQAVSVAFDQDPVPYQVYVAMKGAQEEVGAALDRASASANWYGIGLVGFETTDYREVAEWVESHEKVFGFAFDTVSSPLDISTYNRTFAIYVGDTGVSPAPEDNKFAAVALMAKCLGYQPGSETWALKELADIAPSKITSAKKTELNGANISTYEAYGDRYVTQGGKVGAGEWIDIIRFRDWLKNEIQLKVFDYLRANTKVAYNDNGITGIQNVVLGVLKLGQNMGGIDQSQFDADGNEIVGYSCTVPRAYEISKAQKASRILKDVKFTARLAGAIHAVVINGNLVY